MTPELALGAQFEAHPPQLTVVDEYAKTSLPLPGPSAPRVLQAGIDDVTLNVRIDPERSAMLDAWRMGRGRLGSLGKDGFKDLWAPHVAFWYPRNGVLSIEVKRENKRRLVAAGELSGCAQAVVGILVDAGVVDRGARPFANGLMTCSRLDAAVDVVMPSAAVGLELLRGLELMREWGGYYVDGTGRPGERTVYHKRRRERGRDLPVARVYSRHREELATPRGAVLRFEVERRFKPSVAARTLTAAVVRDGWLAHFVTMAPTNGKVRIGERKAVVTEIAELVASGEVGYRDLERALAFLQMEEIGRAEDVYPSRVVKDRRRLVKRLGLVLGASEATEVDVGAVIALGVDRRHWDVS